VDNTTTQKLTYYVSVHLSII